MELPTYDQLFVPVLSTLQAVEKLPRNQLIESVAGGLNLSDEARKQLLPSGRQRVLDGRVGWAITYLHKAQLLERVSRGVYKITPEGRAIIDASPSRVSLNDLKEIEAFQRWLDESNKVGGVDVQTPEAADAFRKVGAASDDVESTPLERLETAHDALKAELADEVLDALLSVSWQRFEEIVIDTLLALGYGGNRQEAGKAFTTTGDQGVDGVIHEDRLGLSKIYVQAKRLSTESSVSRPVVQAFVGSLIGVRANLGVFITTSRFTAEAKAFTESLSNQSVVLIDGRTLASYMIEAGVGVSEMATYRVQRLDSDYFDT